MKHSFMSLAYKRFELIFRFQQIGKFVSAFSGFLFIFYSKCYVSRFALINKINGKCNSLETSTRTRSLRFICQIQ